MNLEKLDLLEELVKLHYQDQLENNDGTPEDISMKRTYNRQFIDSRMRYIIDYQIPMVSFIEDVQNKIDELLAYKASLNGETYPFIEDEMKYLNIYIIHWQDILKKIQSL